MARAMPLATLSRRALLRLAAAVAGTGAAGVGEATESAPSHREAPLRERVIPASGERLPVVGLGTWQAFDVGPGAAERAPLKAVLETLFAAGGRVVDTAPMYAPAEQVLGDLLAELGQPPTVWLATKVWTTGRAEGIAQMRESLRLLRRERLALMQVHNLVDWQTQLATLRDWQAAGRIRYVGLTHYTTGALDTLADILARERVDFVQVPYSLGVRAAERRLLPLAAERGTAVLINRPYEQGGAFRAVRGRALPPWAAEFGATSWGQFFLKYLLSNPAVTCVIPGTAKVRHLRDNLDAGRGNLPDAAQRRRMIDLWEAL